MSAAPAVHRLKHRCRFCSHWRPIEEFGAAGPLVGQCLTCLEWHRKALAMLAGRLEPACVECGVSHEDARGDVRLYLHRMDGAYALLCRACSDRYVAKRLDQFAGTPYERLRGAH